MIESIEDLERVKKECQSLVTKRASLSAGAAIIPVPGVDLGSDIAILMEMIPTINKRFGLDPEQIAELDTDMKILVMTAISNIGSKFAGKVITKKVVAKAVTKIAGKAAAKNVAKYVPVVGQVVAGSISFGGMKFIGNSHVEECYKIVMKILDDNEGAVAEPQDL